MFDPEATGLGLPLLVTVRSQAVFTLVVTVVLLLAELGSVVVAETVEVAVIVGATTVDGTFTTTTMSAVAPTASVGSVQVTFPVLPTAGVVQVQPAGASTDRNVVLGGVASVKLTPAAEPGPLFVTVCVYEMLFPARTVNGVATVPSARSAWPAVATTSVAVAEFAPKDWFAAFTVTVSVMTVPLAVPPITW